MSGSKTIIEDDGLLDNVHPGDILREDFLIGSEIPIEEVAVGSGIDVARLRKLVESAIPIDASRKALLNRS